MSAPPIRAPREHGAIFAQPPLSDVGKLIAANARGFDDAWQAARAVARQETLAAAAHYLREGGESAPEVTGTSFLLAGHQPELFHPGVWVKNFALHGLAERHHLTPLNLVIDTDTAKSSALLVPVLSTHPISDSPPGWSDDPFAPMPPVQRPDHALAHLARVPFDDWKGDIPYEERAVVNEELFRAFAERVQEIGHGWPFQPMLAQFWSEVQHQAARTQLLGERFAAARRAFERRWGCTNFEVPMSRLCGTASFARFAFGILHDLERFHAAHNNALHDYRVRHGISSRNRPVAELAREQDWLEAPLWAWQCGGAKRHRLFVRFKEDEFELRVGGEHWPSLPANAEGFTVAWRKLTAEGFKIRSRALTTTMFARLYLGDLFIHGIGGAKYDELNDEIIRRFYGVEPPRYLTLSATLLLPFQRFHVDAPQVAQLTAQRRDLWYTPARHVQATRSDVRQLLEARNDWLKHDQTTKTARGTRYHALRKNNHQLRLTIREQWGRVTRQLIEAEQQLEANAVLSRRDFAFCLHPEETLRRFCQQFL